MKRLALVDLLAWRDSDTRKSLLLRGARQVGKTHLIRQFGQYFDSFVEINLEKTKAAHKIFEGDLDPTQLIRDLSLMTSQEIIPGKTLLFIDEIQEVPRAITALRYFYELMPSLHVIAAASLLDFAIEKVGMPVGRVSFLYLYPLSFVEYLKAFDHGIFLKEILEHPVNLPLSDVIHEKYLAYVAEFIAIGGMPEVISVWLKDNNIKKCQNVHYEILNTYRQDFQKYAKETQHKYLDLIFNEIPKLQGQQLQYAHFSGAYRKRELEPCFELLRKARIVNKIFHTDAQGLPLGTGVNDEKFKPIFLDVALSQAALGLDLKEWFLGPREALVNKGNLTEAFVGQELLAYSDPQREERLYYWQREAKSSNAEVDYIICQENKILPIEVKSGKGTTLQSMRVFLASHEKSPYGIRISTHNYSVFDQIHSFPLYAIAGMLNNKERLWKFLELL